MSSVDLTRALSFGATAEAYDRVRPSYPAELIDDLVALRPRSVLDVGAGTGKAAELLIARGIDVLGVERDERMAAVARRKGITVEQSAFEEWDAQGRTFDLIVAGQSWHWMSQPQGARRARAVLNPGGHLAAFWNLGLLEERAAAATDAVYAAIAPALGSGDEKLREHMEDQHRHFDALRRAAFVDIELCTYPWSATYTADQWVAMLATHSDHATMPPELRRSLLAGVHDAITALGGSVVLELGTALILARAPNAVRT